ncbi:MAG: 2-succinyl-6-hydroxy-2,4-cyclohexadiene-carboxylate synthase [Bacteroidota bacterium]|jgi:pimeloyl-ACP methyl ester carboxylesterase
MKPNLILLHGAIGAASQFENLIFELKEKFNIYTFDFEGHGKNSVSNRAFRIEHFTENLIDFIQQNQLQQANIFGYSMGGYIALYLATQKPLMINKIITLATKLDWNLASSIKESALLNAEKIELKVPQFAAILQQRHTLDWKIVLHKTAEMMLHLGNQPLLTSTTFASINCAVKLTVGNADTMVNIDETTMASTHIKNAEIQIIEGFQHPIEKIDTKILADIISNFMLNKKLT